jgi:hypothetical protein
MRRLVLIFIFFVLYFTGISYLGAQALKPVVRIMPFSSQGIGEDEARTIEALIQSYLFDLGENFIDFEVPGVPQALMPEREPDFIISGNLILEGENRVLTITLANTRNGQTLQFSSTHRTTSELALKTRSLVQMAMNSSRPAGTGEPDEAPETPEPLSESRIAGSWRGDTGIEMVRLQAGGTGLLVFSSGARMNVSYRIQGNTLYVAQNSPNTERYYHPVPYGIARQLVELAEPMSWEFSLFGGGGVLRGKKIATAVEYTGDTIIDLFYGNARDAEWTKIR